MGQETAQMIQMKLAAHNLPVREISFSVRLMVNVFHSHGFVMMRRTAKMAQMSINNVREGHAQASSSRVPMGSASQACTGAIEWRTALMEQMKESATTQDVNSYHVQMEHVLMPASDVMAKSIAEIHLMKLIAHVDVPVRSFSVLMESASHEPLSVTMMMTVEIGVMKTLALMQLAEATSSLARVAVAFIRAGFAMETMIVRTMKMKEDVKVVAMNATQESGLALDQGIAFQ